MTHLRFGPSAGASVDAYLEYTRIVGDDDGGKLFTPAEYEAYKRRVMPTRLKNRVFVSWTNGSGMDCKLVGPETSCLCGHRYKQHKTDWETLPESRPLRVPCRGKQGGRACGCPSFQYVPCVQGAQPVRCGCKHTTAQHRTRPPYGCKQEECGCQGFRTSFTCDCGDLANTHSMIVETKQERMARGHPVGEDSMYQAMGGLTGFSSLLDGYARLDPSGRGAPSKEFLNQPITSSDHPFLRANAASIRAHKLATGDEDCASIPTAPGADDDLAEIESAQRRPGETDMEYFERRYQERQRARRTVASRGKAAVRGGSSRARATPQSGSSAGTGGGMSVSGSGMGHPTAGGGRGQVSLGGGGSDWGRGQPSGGGGGAGRGGGQPSRGRGRAGMGGGQAIRDGAVRGAGQISGGGGGAGRSHGEKGGAKSKVIPTAKAKKT